MSVLCCRIPDFLIALAQRQRPELGGGPLILTGPDDRIWAASEAARHSGVHAEMALRQALARCPDATVQTLDLQNGQQVQDGLLAALAEWQLPVEPLGWGLAYVDLHMVTPSQRTDQQAAEHDIRLLAAELGRNVRRTLGDDLQPALGWDSGKFTARAAAAHTRPGCMRLVNKQQEVSFLSPLPITVLPLAPAALQQLHWLGIDTLGQYAKLPAIAVWQRFGQLGKLAQRWAQGQDDRPVRAGVFAADAVIEIDLDPPTDLLPAVVETLMAELGPRLQRAGDQLRGWRRLQIDLRFIDGSQRRIDLAFAAATAEHERIHASLTSRLAALNWPDEASAAMVHILEEAELPIEQMTLFPQADEHAASLQRRISGLVDKYGPVFLQGNVVEAGHPVPARRTALAPFG